MAIFVDRNDIYGGIPAVREIFAALKGRTIPGLQFKAADTAKDRRTRPMPHILDETAVFTDFYRNMRTLP